MDYIFINKQIKTAIYKQIANSIREAILSKRLKHNDHLPTEEEICSTFLISNIVVKQAYKQLVNEGFIKRIRGKGTYVHIIDQKVISFSEFNTYEHTLFKDNLKKKRILIGDAHLSDYQKTLLNADDDHDYVHMIFVGTCCDTPIFVQNLFVQKSFSKYFIETEDERFNTQAWLAQNETEVYQEFMVTQLFQNNAYILNRSIGEAIHRVQSTYLKEGHPYALLYTSVPNEFLKFEYTLGNKL